MLIVECQNVSRIRELEYMIESYSKMVEKQNRTLQREKERAEKLLLNIMPKKVFEEIQSFGVAASQRFDEASVLMLDFIDFTERAESQDPASLVAELNDIFTAFDQIVEQFGVSWSRDADGSRSLRVAGRRTWESQDAARAFRLQSHCRAAGCGAMGWRARGDWWRKSRAPHAIPHKTRRPAGARRGAVSETGGIHGREG